MIGSSRLRVELRLLGVLGMAWTLACAQSGLWARLVLGHDAFVELPWVQLSLPHLVAMVVAGLLLYTDTPRARWSTAVSPRPGLWMIIGLSTLPLAPLFLFRDLGLAQQGPPSPASVGRAFAQLLRLPRLLGLRFWTWFAAALVVDIGVLVRGTGLALPVALGLLALWLCVLTPVALVLTGLARSFVRPQILAAPHRVTRFPARAVLRARMTTQAALVSIALVLAPLWAAALVTPRDGSSAPWGALAFAGVVFSAAALAAGVFVARSVHHDIVRATARVHAVVHDAPIPVVDESSFATYEARTLVAAIDRMVGRISESNVAHYVAIEKAKEADRLKSQFLANMSHDLRSPLNAILGFSELLLSGIDGELNNAQKDMVALVLGSGRDLLHEIDDILDTAKIDAGRLELAPEPTPVANLVTRAIALAKKRVSELGQPGVRVAPGLPVAVCDPARTVQAIANVLLFAQEGVETPDVDIEVKLGNNAQVPVVLVEVHVGHHPATPGDLARARAGFFRIPGHRGLGLGLPLAAAVLELQGGALDIETLPETMVFTLEIPATNHRVARGTPGWVERQRAGTA